MTKRTRALIIGAGPAGLTAGWELLRRDPDGFDVDVLEADPTYVGGIARTVEHRGYRFDVGGHRFFSKNPEIEQVWDEILGHEMLTRQRLSRIYYDGRFFFYPLRAGNALKGLGALRSAKVLASYAKARVAPIQPERSLADWVSNRFGRELFEIFFRSYTEKVWGIRCEELSADWAAQRIKGLSLSSALRDALLGKGEDGVVKSLIDTFRYPRLGPGMMWEAAAGSIQDRGGRVLLDRRVVELRRSQGRITSVLTRNSTGEQERLHADQFISSMPLSLLVRCLRPQVPAAILDAARDLRHRAFVTVLLIIRQADLFPDNWIYIHDPSVRVGRLQNFKNWSPDLVPDPNTTSIGMEYFCDLDDDFWALSDEELIDLAGKELDQIGLARRADLAFGTVFRVPRAYPVYDEGYTQRVEVLRRWLDEEATNLQLIGRAGMHRYNNQDHAMMTGLLAARNLLGEHWDPWRVNTDAEYLEGS
ncbi:MAG: NAD(P)/FAD-dependent oxidoreductase [Myxococcota bacterium]|nr:NAD(P)/FAD-dependent oxidoreductase [Myxococcota bacterium]